MHSRELLTPFSTWLHEATRSTYTVIGVALCSTNGPGEHEAESVVYVSHTHGGLCYRLLSEFLDGRFTPVR